MLLANSRTATTLPNVFILCLLPWAAADRQRASDVLPSGRAGSSLQQKGALTLPQRRLKVFELDFDLLQVGNRVGNHGANELPKALPQPEYEHPHSTFTSIQARPQFGETTLPVPGQIGLQLCENLF